MMQSRGAGRTLLSSILIGLASLMMVGCASHYKVTDTNTGKIYYTQGIKKKTSGAIEFKDARTGANVTVQASEYLNISKDSFTAGVAEQK